MDNLEKEFFDKNPSTSQELQFLIQRIWQRAYLDYSEEQAKWINEYAAKAAAALCREKIKQDRAKVIALINKNLSELNFKEIER